MLWYFLLGLITGMRTMTVMAVLSWFAYFGAYEPIPQSWAFWTAKLITPLIFTAAALSEYFVDVQPQTPSRRAPALAITRMIFGGLIGAIAAAAMIEPAAGGAILGVLGAIAGTWGGYAVRMRLARAFGRDLPAGLTESAFALLLAIFVCFTLHTESATAVSFLNR